MKKTFKKAVAVIAAAASLTVGMTAISANAGYVSRDFDTNATAYLSVSTTSIYGYTKSTTSKYLTVRLKNYTGTITSGSSYRYGTTTNVVAQLYGSGIGFSNSSHTAGGVSLSQDLAVWS